MATNLPTTEAAMISCATPEAGHFFFGYYDKSPWHLSGRWMLAGRATFQDRAPKSDDRLTVGLIDLERSCAFIPLAETLAWNWQQGCMLQWLDEKHIVFNDRRSDRFVAVIVNVRTGEQRELPRPVYTLCPTRGIATSLNFARLHRLRPGYGYAGLPDPTAGDAAPEDDGLWMMDLRDGEAERVFSIEQARRILPKQVQGSGPHWLNHAQFAPGGRRLAVLHRWRSSAEPGPWHTRMLTLNADGGEPYPLVDAGMCSHYDWRDETHLLAFARVAGMEGEAKALDGFFRFRDRTAEAVSLAPQRLSEDGHCSYSPDRQWILNDTYPDPADQCRTLMLVRAADGEVFEIGRFFSPMPDQAEIRCDLHPRWSPDGRQVCIDSIHEGRRAMYTVDVTALVSRCNGTWEF
ncbi:hypothetical protein ACERK3_11015 [Phycisphaerales bacterium AB-hyl4]|uniref:Uncharacterized protein n=1 Tax=Natronomicrosphaera hydrolytica TaxID=3242702 RepID=A0ABV4U961_9BACT